MPLQDLTEKACPECGCTPSVQERLTRLEDEMATLALAVSSLPECEYRASVQAIYARHRFPDAVPA